MARILPLTNPSTSVGGRSAHWHCSWDSKPCLPCRHSIMFSISSACSLVAFLSKGFGGVLQYMATQSCCRTPYSLWPNRPEIQPVWIRAQTGWELRSQHWMSWIRWTALPPITCTPRWHQKATDRLPHLPLCATPPNTSHTKYRVRSANVACVSLQTFRISDTRQISVGQFFVIFHSHFNYNAEQCHEHFGSVTCTNSYYHVIHLVLAVWTPTSWPTYWQSIVGCRRRHLPPNPLWLPDSRAVAAPASGAVRREGWLGPGALLCGW